MESLTQLLRRFQRHPSQTLAGQIFPLLAQAQVYVPVCLEQNSGVPVQGDAFGLRPDTIPGPEGKVLFPAFSAQEQIPNDYGARFSFLHLPFPAFCRAALADPRFGGLALDPFTAKFLLSEEITRSFSSLSGSVQ